MVAPCEQSVKHLCCCCHLQPYKPCNSPLHLQDFWLNSCLILPLISPKTWRSFQSPGHPPWPVHLNPCLLTSALEHQQALFPVWSLPGLSDTDLWLQLHFLLCTLAVPQGSELQAPLLQASFPWSGDDISVGIFSKSPNAIRLKKIQLEFQALHCGVVPAIIGLSWFAANLTNYVSLGTNLHCKMYSGQQLHRSHCHNCIVPSLKRSRGLHFHPAIMGSRAIAPAALLAQRPNWKSKWIQIVSLYKKMWL